MAGAQRRGRWGTAAAGSAVLHVVVLAGVYFASDFLPAPEVVSLPAPQESAPVLFLDADEDSAPPEQILMSSTFDPAAAQTIRPMVETPTTDTGASPGATDATAPAAPASVKAAPGKDEGAHSSAPLWFPEAVTARSVVFVVDRSGSMGRASRLLQACREMSRTLELLPADARFQVLAYNRRVERLPDTALELVPATAENKRLASAWLASLAPEGGTDDFPALRQAVLLEADLIYFLTDGDDLSPAQAHLVTQLNRGRSVVHTLELGTQPHSDSATMLDLAQANRGTYRRIDLRLGE